MGEINRRLEPPYNSTGGEDVLEVCIAISSYKQKYEAREACDYRCTSCKLRKEKSDGFNRGPQATSCLTDGSPAAKPVRVR